MLDRRDPEPAFAAPFVSSVMRVEPGWIDYNGHLNMAYYNVLFDRAVDEVYELLGLRPRLRQDSAALDLHRRGACALSARASCRRSRCASRFQLLDFDAKRLHYFEQLFHAEEGWLSATSENMALHVDMAAKKTAPFPDDVTARLARMKAAHAGCRCRKAPAGASPCRATNRPGRREAPDRVQTPSPSLVKAASRCHLLRMRNQWRTRRFG